MSNPKNQLTTARGQLSIRELAKQGNPTAIAMLMNRSLQPKGITAKVALKNDCLQVMLESDRVPATDWVRVIRKGLVILDVTSIKQVRVYGRQVGEKNPDWIQEIKFATPTDLKKFKPNSSSKLGNVKNQFFPIVFNSTNFTKNFSASTSDTKHKVNPTKNYNLIFIRLVFAGLGLLGLIKSLLFLSTLLLNQFWAIASLHDPRRAKLLILENLLIFSLSSAYIYISFLLKSLLIQFPRIVNLTLWLVVGYFVISLLFNLTGLTSLVEKSITYQVSYFIGLASLLFVNGYLLYSVRRLSVQLRQLLP